MTTNLRKYFPTIRTKAEVLQEVRKAPALSKVYDDWNEIQQMEFLNFCTGVKGIKLLYDSFFKEIINPESTPERLEEILSLILHMQVKILTILPNDSTRIANETSLLILDIVVELEDGSIANVEVQKLGYAFPGQRSACYSADLLLRQYKRVKSEQKKKFSYKDIKKVYTIVLFEKSVKNFHAFPQQYIHHFQQKSDTGLEMELLQDFIFIALDIFREIQHNNGIKNKLEAWLTFLSMDSPEDIIHLIEEYPEFKKMYEEVYTLCLNTERVMGMFSKELLELDKNTVQYMIDEMQDEIDAQNVELDKRQDKINAQNTELDKRQGKINAQNTELDKRQDKINTQEMKLEKQRQEIAELHKKLAELTN